MFHTCLYIQCTMTLLEAIDFSPDHNIFQFDCTTMNNRINSSKLVQHMNNILKAQFCKALVTTIQAYRALANNFSPKQITKSTKTINVAPSIIFQRLWELLLPSTPIHRRQLYLDEAIDSVFQVGQVFPVPDVEEEGGALLQHLPAGLNVWQ